MRKRIKEEQGEYWEYTQNQENPDPYTVQSERKAKSLFRWKNPVIVHGYQTWWKRPADVTHAGVICQMMDWVSDEVAERLGKERTLRKRLNLSFTYIEAAILVLQKMPSEYEWVCTQSFISFKDKLLCCMTEMGCSDLGTHFSWTSFSLFVFFYF